MAIIDTENIMEQSFSKGRLITDLPNEEHYGGRIQPIEFMQASMTQEEFIGFLKGNVIKYVSRAGKKQGADINDDLTKAERYLVWLKQVIDGHIIDPRMM